MDDGIPVPTHDEVEVISPTGVAEESMAGVVPWLDFVSSVVDSISWPIAILVLAWVFRKAISQLLQRVASIRWGDKHIDFDVDDAISKAREQAEKVMLAAGDSASSGYRMSNETLGWMRWSLNTTIGNPRQAIIEAWLGVEAALDAAAERLEADVPIKGRRLPGLSLRLLRTSGHLNADWTSLLYRLRRIRNEAAHERRFELAPDQAEDYVRLCANVVNRLQAITPNR